jgi:hypothetical protein
VSLDTRARDGARALCQGAPASEFVEALDSETAGELFWALVMRRSETTDPVKVSGVLGKLARRFDWLSRERYRDARRDYIRACVREDRGAAEVPCGARSEDGSLTCGLVGAHRGMHLDTATNTGWVAP